MTKEYEEQLAMFFDLGFQASNYINALHQSILSSDPVTSPKLGQSTLSTTTNNLTHSNTHLTGHGIYTEQNLQSINNSMGSLITHLDYYVLELNQDMMQQMEKLGRILEGDESSASGGSNRLNYYLNMLDSNVSTLDEELVKATKELDTVDQTDPGNAVVAQLIKFKQIEDNIKKVLGLFTMIEKHDGTVDFNQDLTVEKFQTLTDRLYKSLSKLMIQDANYNSINQDTLETIESFIDLQQLFKNLTQFFPIYKKFAINLIDDKNRYLSMRKHVL